MALVEQYINNYNTDEKCSVKKLNKSNKDDVNLTVRFPLYKRINNANAFFNNKKEKCGKRIALISVHGDPAVDIGKEEAGGQNVYVRQVGEALGALGWQVDMFTRKISPSQANVVEHTPNCRTIRLQAGPLEHVSRDNLFVHANDFVESFLNFQQQSGNYYPVVHTNYWISGYVGLCLKKIHGCKQVHTYHSLGSVKYRAVNNIPACAKTRLDVERMILETADRVIATSPQEKEDMRDLVSQLGNITIIPCGTDVRRFGNCTMKQGRAKLGFSDDSLIVFYVGRFDERKGIETLVRAVG
ncbi:glycoside hydrolase-like protein [Dinothrombium tinctorium]|uniref:Glycoside hydrolase-like protein n=1 Tax=Dinothrombium tinctorium TaxID=1965070 RepID=A0A3S3PHC0_9ACAR|nr:glycoside hydrolase-like protein [Dinothrombium tinctorium]